MRSESSASLPAIVTWRTTGFSTMSKVRTRPPGAGSERTIDVLEEAERVDLAHVVGDLRGRCTDRPGASRCARGSRPPRCACCRRCGSRRRGRRSCRRVAGCAATGSSAAEVRRNTTATPSAVRSVHGRGAGDAADAPETLEVVLERRAVVGLARLRAELAAQLRLVDRRAAFETHLGDTARRRDVARHDADHALRELADALEQLGVAVGGEDHGARRHALSGGRDPDVEAVRAGELGDAALHDPLGADLARELAQHVVGAFARDVRDQRLAHDDGVHDRRPCRWPRAGGSARPRSRSRDARADASCSPGTAAPPPAP